MTTALAVYNLRGCVGRCDANCHEAKHDKCTCICGGLNHGFGFKRARENVAKEIGLTREDLLAFAKATQRDPNQLTVVNRVKVRSPRRARRQARDRLMQLDLFDQVQP